MNIKKLSVNAHLLGEFTLTTPVMRVSDPCYEKDVWCCGVLENCVEGSWEAAVYYTHDGYAAGLAVRSAGTSAPSFADLDTETEDWAYASFEVGVDSGQAGFYDDTMYQDDSVVEEDPDFSKNCNCSKWFGLCCDKTLSKQLAGIIPYGVVSSAGYGDGGYDCEYHTNADGKIDFAWIRFI